MMKSHFLLSFTIVFVLLQMVSSKSCRVNNNCPKGQCCLEKDGKKECSDLTKPGHLCTVSNGSNSPQSGTCYCIPGYRCKELKEKEADVCVNNSEFNSAETLRSILILSCCFQI
ncbi:uncharacterized protein LOC118179633 [Stegodyphus dumicola]|uniref:uncharacterized protein LOC118179633 n=1 Tax=Stegodyphus dumicola TaxID=202533 RepID=UPI0015AB17E9|nr:uncharacterized protein LOC118179633 [Stegodyphus dumicola]